jgi:hypothetical protein
MCGGAKKKIWVCLIVNKTEKVANFIDFLGVNLLWIISG